MPVNNDNIVGAVNELLELFKKQQAITNKALNSKEISNTTLINEREEAEKIAADFEFLSGFILENVSVEDNHHYIGKMLLNARQQAEAILNEAKTEVEKLKADNQIEIARKEEQQSVEANPASYIEELEKEPVVEEVASVSVEEVAESTEIPEVIPGDVTELSANHLHQTKEIHQKYKDSLDSILKEIDVFLER